MVVVSGVAVPPVRLGRRDATLYQYVTGATLKQRSSNDENSAGGQLHLTS